MTTHPAPLDLSARGREQKADVAAAVVAAVLRGLDRHLVSLLETLTPLGRRLAVADLERAVVEVLDGELGWLTWGEWWAADRAEEPQCTPRP